MGKSEYMKDWWEGHPELRKVYEKRRRENRTPEQRAALQEYQKAWRAKNHEEVKAKDKAKYQRRKVEIAAKERHTRVSDPGSGMLKAAKIRATRSNLPFDLCREDLFIPEFCPVLGIRIEVGAGSPLPGSPSLDRVVPSLGYVRGNVCVISHRANCIKRDGTAAELRLIADYIELMGGE